MKGEEEEKERSGMPRTPVWNDGVVNISEEVMFVKRALEDESFTIMLRCEPVRAKNLLGECASKLHMARNMLEKAFRDHLENIEKAKEK